MKKNIIIIIFVIVLIISFVLGLSGFIINNKKTNNNVDNKISIEDQIKEIIKDSYIYYALYQKPIEQSEDFINIDDKNYYYLNIENIKSINDIDNLISKLFLDNEVEYRKKELFSKRDFKENDGKLYVYSNNDGCEVNYDLINEENSYKIQEDGSILLVVGNEEALHEFYLYEDNNKKNNYKISDLLYDCKKNFKYIKTE